MHLLRIRKQYRHKSHRKRCRQPEVGAQNSNMMSDYKLEVKIASMLRVRSEKIAKLCEKLHRTSEIFALCGKSELLNLFSTINLRSDVELSLIHISEPTRPY